jgi:hypothetical protein
VRTNWTISSGYIVNSTFNLRNIPDGTTLFNANATSNETDWWIYITDLTINDSENLIYLPLVGRFFLYFIK